MNKRFRVGLVGLSPHRGWAASAHVPALRALPEVNPVGTHRFEISAPAITTALRKAKEMTLFKNATIFGRSIHALVRVDARPCRW